MTLTKRLSDYFALMLLVVLVGFSTTLFFVARSFLYHQVDERRDSAMRVLAVAVERREAGFEWEPAGRLPAWDEGGQVPLLVWMVRDDQGSIVAKSKGLKSDVGSLLVTAPDEETRYARGSGEPWRVKRQLFGRLQRDHFEEPDQDIVPRGSTRLYTGLEISVGTSLTAARASVYKLGMLLGAVSLAIVLGFMFVGQRVCKAALLPVRRMADNARKIQATDFDSRLPELKSGDELENLTVAFNGLLNRLQESCKRQSRFAGEASHQLRTPLAALLGQVDVALRRDRSGEDYRAALSVAREQAFQLSRIIESLLFLTRLDSDAELPHLIEVELRAWLTDYLKTWSDHPRAPDLRMECNAGDPLMVQVQPVLLGEMLNNLLDNACKYSQPGTPITVRIQREQEAICLAVEDCGRGISREDLSQLFTPFFRSTEARIEGVPGTGLGLTIAARIARSQGGIISAQPNVDRGTTFTVRLSASELPNAIDSQSLEPCPNSPTIAF